MSNDFISSSGVYTDERARLASMVESKVFVFQKNDQICMRHVREYLTQ